MRSEVGEWLATCVGSPICILLLSWSLLIYQNQGSSNKRRIDVLTVAILTESLIRQLGLLCYAILTLIHPTNHFGEICSSLVWLLNSSSVLQELTLTSISIFAAITSKDRAPNVTKNHLKYHIVSLSVISACIGITGVINFEPQVCVFLSHEISFKYGIFVNTLRTFLIVTSFLSLLVVIYKNTCRSDKSELLKSISDLSETSSKHSSFDCQQQQRGWDPSNGSCTTGSTNSRACLKKTQIQFNDSSSTSTVYSIIFVCYVFECIPLLVVSIRPSLLKGLCTVQNLATWLPLVKDTLLPVFLALFDRMFCRYVAKVYTKQDHARRLSHVGMDGKFRHFEQDAEYKLQLNLNHGLKFPLTNGSLYGRLHNLQNRGRTGTITMGIQHYPRSQSLNDDSNYASLPAELSSLTSSNFEPRRQDSRTIDPRQSEDSRSWTMMNRRKLTGSTDVFGQNMENLVQLEDKRHVKSVLGLENLLSSFDSKDRRQMLHPNRSFDRTSKRKRSLDCRTYDVKKERSSLNRVQILNCYDSSDDEDDDDGSCDLENNHFDTMSSCRSHSRSCCSVTTVANDDFEYFQRKGTKVELLPTRRYNGDVKVNMRSFTPRIIDNNNKKIDNHEERRNELTKPIIQSYHLKDKQSRIASGYSMNDIDKLTNERKFANVSLESLKSVIQNTDYSYLDNGDVCRHDIGGSVPDLKKFFLTEFI